MSLVLEMLVGRCSWLCILPGDDLHTELAMPIGPSQVTIPPCPTCLQSCPVKSLSPLSPWLAESPLHFKY